MRNTILTLAFIAASGPASAHAILVGSTPEAGGHVTAGRLAATLRYNSRIDAARSKLTLTGPTGPAARIPLAQQHAPDTLEATLTLTPGAYVLRWQVLATDGHITRGNVPFTVDAAR